MAAVQAGLDHPNQLTSGTAARKYGYVHGVVLGRSGHVGVTVSLDKAELAYGVSFLAQDCEKAPARKEEAIEKKRQGLKLNADGLIAAVPEKADRGACAIRRAFRTTSERDFNASCV